MTTVRDDNRENERDMDDLSKDELIRRLKEQLEEADQRADKEKNRADQEKNRADQEKERAEKANALKEGSYYASILSVILEQVRTIPSNSLDRVRRNSKCDRFYKTAIEAAEASTDALQPAITSSRTSGYDEGNPSAARKRRKKLETIGLDGTAQDAAEIAHLVPHSQRCASLYGHLLEAMVGVKFVHPREKRLQVLIHGQEVSGGGKERKTGIKHCVMNLIRVMHQKKYMDAHPSQVVLLPILSVEEILHFGEPGHSEKFFVAVMCSKPAVYKEMVLTGEYKICQQSELVCAIDTLRMFTFAVAEHVRENVSGEDLASIASEKNFLIHSRDQATLMNEVMAPTFRTPTGETPRVLKVEFDGTCDPWLLCLKSAVMYSSFAERKLLPGCGPPPAIDFASESYLSEYSVIQTSVPTVPTEITGRDNVSVNSEVTDGTN